MHYSDPEEEFRSKVRDFSGSPPDSDLWASHSPDRRRTNEKSGDREADPSSPP